MEPAPAHPPPHVGGYNFQTGSQPLQPRQRRNLCRTNHPGHSPAPESDIIRTMPLLTELEPLFPTRFYNDAAPTALWRVKAKRPTGKCGAGPGWREGWPEWLGADLGPVFSSTPSGGSSSLNSSRIFRFSSKRNGAYSSPVNFCDFNRPRWPRVVMFNRSACVWAGVRPYNGQRSI